MNYPITLPEFQTYLSKVKVSDEWHPQKGTRARYHMKQVKPFRRSKCVEKKQRYIQTKKMIRNRFQSSKEDVVRFLPNSLSGSTKRNVESFCRLLIKYERQISPNIHRIFEVKMITWKFIVELSKYWRESGVAKCHFPSFILNACWVVRGESLSFSDFPITHVQTNFKGQRYFGKDIWPFFRRKTRRDWEGAADVCPTHNCWQDALTYDWPPGLIFLNTDFSKLSKFWKHIKEQKKLGKITEILMIMPFDRWYGARNGEPSDWVQELQTNEDYTFFNLRYRFFKPDGTRYDSTFHIICVHIIFSKYEECL